DIEEEFAQAPNVERGPVLPVKPNIRRRQGVSLADGSYADTRSEGCGLPPVISLTRRVTDPGLFVIPCSMAWRPYENLIDGHLDNRSDGRNTGWVRFYQRGMYPLKVELQLEGDFHEDIRGSVLRLKNPRPSDKNETLGARITYMDGFLPTQHGTAGDI